MHLIRSVSSLRSELDMPGISSRSSTSPLTVTDTVASVVLSFLAAAICLHRLAAQPLWNDEAFSYFVAWRGVLNTLDFVRLDTQPPGYYLALTGWLNLGHGPFALRSLSSLSIIAAVPLLYNSARRLFNTPTALLATLLFVVDPTCVFWGQKARPYALQAFCVAVSFWGFARIWVAPPRERRVGAWLAYAVGGGLAVLSQYPAGFFVLGCNVAIGFRILRRRRADYKLLAGWVIANLVTVAIFALWLPGFLDQAAAHLTPERISERHRIFLISGQDLVKTLLNLLSI